MRTLYRAARIHTFGHPPTGEWILVDGRHVQRVGTGDPPAADRVVELPGATILPGFIDAHVHLTSTGLGLANADVVRATSATELLAIARDRAAARGPLVALQGFDETLWERRDLPTLEDLDRAVSGPLVIRRIDGHAALANRASSAAPTTSPPVS